jgi:hypothetical protein
MPTKEKETIFGSKNLVVSVVIFCLLTIVGELYFHQTLMRYGYFPARPLKPEEKQMIGIATLALIANLVALLGGGRLVNKMRDKTFVRRFNLASIPFLVAVSYFLLPWPWWLIAAVVAIPLAFALEERRLRKKGEEAG